MLQGATETERLGTGGRGFRRRKTGIHPCFFAARLMERINNGGCSNQEEKTI